MKAFKKMMAAALAASVLLTGCFSSEEKTPTDTVSTLEELESYLDASQDEMLSGLEGYYSPSHLPEGMSLTRIEVQPERHFITYYYNLGRYEPTAEEMAEEIVEDIDVSMFSFFPTSTSSKKKYTPERLERTVLKETDEYQFRWCYAGDGEAMLERGKEFYGDKTEIGNKTYYITEVTQRMLVGGTPEGEGLDVAFYQVVWTEGDYLYFVKLPVEFVGEKEDIPPYLEMEWRE